jgi:hypothetical protein
LELAMKTIQINYDLRKPGRDYESLYKYLRSYPTRCRPLQSLWLVRTSKSASMVRDELKKHVDRNDKVLVFDVTGDAWASNFSDAETGWMKRHVRVRTTNSIPRLKKRAA